jgi:TRAP-type mannitol/chloroaromatic compound transport system substrate-binding protein
MSGIFSRACFRAAGIAAIAALLVAPAAPAVDISFRNFSGAAAIGPPADAFAARLQIISTTVLGKDGQIRFVKAIPMPAIPKEFKNVLAAVGAGGPLAGGAGFDAAYISGSDLDPTWGFIYNSGVPFGPEFNEFLGFLYGRTVDEGAATGLDLLQQLLDRNGRNVVAIPIVGSSQQLSGYFMLPVGDAGATKGIGLAGLCQQSWTFRYLPPAQYVLDGACDGLVASGAIPKKNIKFIQALAGGGSLVKAVADGQLQAFEFASPLDDVSQLFGLPEGNPGTVGNRFVHFPGWHQQFLVTYMLVNKKVWGTLSPAQQTLVQSVARDHVLTSYAENLRQQGAKLKEILTANDGLADEKKHLVLVAWPESDLKLLKDATIQVLNARVADAAIPEPDRKDFARVLEALRTYVSANSAYWKLGQVPNALRFQGWLDPDGKKSWEQKLK